MRKSLFLILTFCLVSLSLSAQDAPKAKKACCASIEACAKANNMTVEECKALCGTAKVASAESKSSCASKAKSSASATDVSNTVLASGAEANVSPTQVASTGSKSCCASKKSSSTATTAAAATAVLAGGAVANANPIKCANSNKCTPSAECAKKCGMTIAECIASCLKNGCSATAAGCCKGKAKTEEGTTNTTTVKTASLIE